MTDRHCASFRDPSGFVYHREGRLLRQVNRRYSADYDCLMSSGLYSTLVEEGLLVPHREAETSLAVSDDAYKVIEPEVIPFISYPYEWCFSELKAAALATLSIQKKALQFGMSLKDASAYNIQFRGTSPALIDTLSFETQRDGEPWVAYRQFCQHFLAPLALAAYADVRLTQLLRVHIDGIPLDLAAGLLPWRTRLSLSLFSHIHLQARFQSRYAGAQDKPVTKRRIGRMGLLGIIDSLETAVRRLSWTPAGTEWGDYYSDTNYGDAAFDAKKRLVAEFAVAASPRVVWDLGANTGLFTRVAAEAAGASAVAFDIDPAAVEKNYRACVQNRERNLLPLVMDLANPSAGIGWNNAERRSLAARGPADMALALALVHHLAISNNVPLAGVAEFLAGLAGTLVIEFVPKSDSQVRRLLVTREDVFDGYAEGPFEEAFGRLYSIERKERIPGTERVLYLMRGRR